MIFYLDPDKKTRLESMNPIQRSLHKFGWLIKSMFLHLTPLRRILVLLGVIFLSPGRNISLNNGSFSLSSNEGLFGGLLILFVLFLELKDKLVAKNELEAGRKVQRALMPEQNYPMHEDSITYFSSVALGDPVARRDYFSSRRRP